MARARELDVYVYLDYRAYLRDYYETKKASSRGFSFRSFSRRAGLKSPNYLKLVMDGDRNLTAPMAERFARTCGLDDEGVAFFVALVAFNQARSASERNGAYSRLTGFRRYRQAHQLDLQHAAYHSTWYLPAIREMVLRPDFVEDPSWVAKALVPTIAKADARAALDTLLELGLLERDAEGRLRQSEALVTTGPETRGLHIGNYHRTMMERAAASIDLVPSSDRDISSLTLCLSEDGLRTVKERIQRFRRELLELSVLEDEPRQVIQVNFQLFPLSRVEVES